MLNSDLVTLDGIRITTTNNEYQIAVRDSKVKMQYKPDSLFRNKEEVIKRVAKLLNIEIQIVKKDI